ncbi:hypothetical protein B4O97_18310 [Marispirochaeta aestuarii]|uniref:Uncharacterized protein n=2 Tax=Marispirochaeta aestuarii TaxID=1963862 RepID=A0A1Y1RUD6_9SPIO|nr:hypothetical protein B4O97_18310 [Marispirochaeta aestuarii]
MVREIGDAQMTAYTPAGIVCMRPYSIPLKGFPCTALSLGRIDIAESAAVLLYICALLFIPG